MIKLTDASQNLNKYGCYIVREVADFRKVNFKKIQKDTQNLIDKLIVYTPSRSFNLSDLSTEPGIDMEKFQKTFQLGEQKISNSLFKGGEKNWSNLVPQVTIKEPLYNLPSISDLVFNPMWLDIASDYLGGPAKITFAKVKKTYGNNININSTDQKYHVDDNADEKLLKFIIYLNDVEKGNGGFHYVKNSKFNSLKENRHYFEDSEIELAFPEEDILEFIGKAGSAIFVDTLGIHKAGLISNSDRYALLINFGLKREYNGERKDQLIKKDIYDSLNTRVKPMCEFMEIKV